MILTCPACHATGAIEAFTKDEAASEFVNLAGNLQPSQWRALIAYIGMFRTGRKIPFERALKLAREVMALDADPTRLEAALFATVESMRVKREDGTFRPLKNHRYLMTVLADTPAGSTPLTDRKQSEGRSLSGAEGPASKTAKGIGRLEDWKKG